MANPDLQTALQPIEAASAFEHDVNSRDCLVTFLKTLQDHLVRYESPSRREQDVYISCAKNLANAQFQLADAELSRRLWQDVAERKLDVDRLLNLMYGCWFPDDLQAMQEADRDYQARHSMRGQTPEPHGIGIFEHC